MLGGIASLYAVPAVSSGLSNGDPASSAGKNAAQDRPNVLIIIADDCNYYNIGCYGAENNRTPNIDALAEEGMRFTNAYNSVSMSVPTRHCLYTGMYPMKHGGYPNHSSIREGIKTMPVYLSELGYRVGLAGKWHIKPLASFPFDSIPGFPAECVTKDPSHTLDGVTEFVTRDPNQPFCMVLASVNPHAPWTGGDPSKYDRSKLVLPPIFVDTPETRKSYASYLAEVDLLDQEVGEVVSLLKEKGMYDNTLIFFLSEQGSQFVGAKWTNWYPGVRAAMIAKWTGHIKPGRVTDAIVQYEDILPSLILLAGGTPGSDMDGRNILPLLEGKTDKHREYAFHVHNNIPEGPAYPIRSVSDGRYRLIWNLTPERTYKEKHIENAVWFKSWKASEDPQAQFIVNRWYHRPEFELYDITVDPFELNNLADDKQYAKIKTRLHKALKEWMESQNDPGAAADAPRK